MRGSELLNEISTDRTGQDGQDGHFINFYSIQAFSALTASEEKTADLHHKVPADGLFHVFSLTSPKI